MHDLQATRDGEPIAQAESQQDGWWNRGGGWPMTPSALGLHPQPQRQKDLDSWSPEPGERELGP